MTGKRILVGKIRSAHGIKGLVKVEFFGEDVSLLQDTPLYASETSQDAIHVKVKNQMKDIWLCEIDNVRDKTQADTLRGTDLFIDRHFLPDLEEGEHYFVDLIGRLVKSKDGHALGKAISFQNFGASDLMEVKAKGKPSFYIPYTDACILEITEEQIIVDMPEML